MKRLAEALGIAGGPQLWIKRDDLTGMGFGGNKGRKLEFSFAEAQKLGADVVMTSGGNQSNHCRQTAIAAAKLGIEAHLFLKGSTPEQFTGNLLPSKLCGTHFHFLGDADAYGDTPSMTAFAEQLSGEGRTPYVIPGGASNNIGAMGYVNAARELAADQQRMGFEFDWIFHPTGSTGTQAGLLAGAKLFGLKAKIVGVAVGTVEDMDDKTTSIARFANSVLRDLGSDKTVAPEEVSVLGDYVGERYSVPTDAGREAVDLFAKQEGLFLDNTYTGKAAAGMLDWIRRDKFATTDRVLFIHTGGSLALFA